MQHLGKILQRGTHRSRWDKSFVPSSKITRWGWKDSTTCRSWARTLAIVLPPMLCHFTTIGSAMPSDRVRLDEETMKLCNRWTKEWPRIRTLGSVMFWTGEMKLPLNVEGSKTWSRKILWCVLLEGYEEWGRTRLTLSLYDGNKPRNTRYSTWLSMNGYMPNSSLQNSHMAITIR